MYSLHHGCLISLGHQDNFYYLNQGECPYVTDVDDGEGFEEMREAMDFVGIMEDQQLMIFRILAGILHIGNIDIQPSGEDESQIDVRNTTKLINTCTLCVNWHSFMSALNCREPTLEVR